jgi:hypothetical protein
LEAGELKICKRLRETERLVRELESMAAEGGGGEHDDLVFAVALAAWRARRAENGFEGAAGILVAPRYNPGLINGRARKVQEVLSHTRRA